jgi:hypothetical protein
MDWRAGKASLCKAFRTPGPVLLCGFSRYLLALLLPQMRE